MTAKLDRRLHAYRDDLADASLAGRVEAARFVEGQPYHVAAAIAPLYQRPSTEADFDTEALGGEAVHVFEAENGWAWCQLASDGYVGYVPADLLLGGAPSTATHKVRAREAFAYCQPTARSKPQRSWLFGSTITIAADAPDGFLEIAETAPRDRQYC